MGGKAIRRREKNYKAAHDGGNSTRLPPPPDLSSIDALPSKLRRLMSFAGFDFSLSLSLSLSYFASSIKTSEYPLPQKDCDRAFGNLVKSFVFLVDLLIVRVCALGRFF